MEATVPASGTVSPGWVVLGTGEASGVVRPRPPIAKVREACYCTTWVEGGVKKRKGVREGLER